MKELLDRFSVERLEEIIGRAEFWGHGGGYTPCEVIALARIALAVKQAQLSGLKRYDLDQSNCDSCGQDCGADMSEEPDGDYVLFADVVSLLTSAPERGQ